jgi:epoxyqueuosine reductase QueG
VTRDKLAIVVSVKLDPDDLDALDRYMRDRERATGVPFTRSLAMREILRERLRSEPMADAVG